jgi:hypothetical protein
MTCTDCTHYRVCHRRKKLESACYDTFIFVTKDGERGYDRLEADIYAAAAAACEDYAPKTEEDK